MTEKRDNLVILVSGFKRAGKDFISSLLHEKLPHSMVYSFAKPLKEIMATTLNVSLDDLDKYKNRSEVLLTYDDCDELLYLTNFRILLQVFGTEAMKKWFGDSVWVDAFLKQDFKDDIIIISDWRFKIEYDEVKKVYPNTVTLRVTNNNITNVDEHPSETELIGYDFDYEIDNTLQNASVTEQVQNFISEVYK